MTSERKGELLILFQAILWALFPIVTKLTTSFVDPLIALTVTTFFSLLLFFVIIVYKKKLYELKVRGAVWDSIKAGVLISIIFYGLTFYGIHKTGAGSASIVLQLEILTSFLFFNIWRKEYINRSHIYGCILMLIGGILVFSPNVNGFRFGDLLILLAVCVTPLGNFYQRKASQIISVESVLFVRTMVAVVALSIFTLYTNPLSSFVFSGKDLFWLVFNGVVIFGVSKIVWLLGIQKISVTKAHAMSIISPVGTVLIAYLFLNEKITFLQFVSLIPISFGVYFLTREPHKTIKNIVE